MLQDGSLVAPGTADTLKYDGTNPPVVNTSVTATASTSRTFESLVAAAGVTVPNLAKLLGLFPIDSSHHGGDNFYLNSADECVAVRGGGWTAASSAGVFALSLYSPRSASFDSIGFRAAFIP